MLTSRCRSCHFFKIKHNNQQYFFCHDPIVQHRATLEHWETMVSTTAKVTIRGSLPVRKQLFVLTIRRYKTVLPLWKVSSTSAFWSVQGSRIPAVTPGFQPSPQKDLRSCCSLLIRYTEQQRRSAQSQRYHMLSISAVLSTCFSATPSLSKGPLSSLIYSCVI